MLCYELWFVLVLPLQVLILLNRYKLKLFCVPEMFDILLQILTQLLIKSILSRHRLELHFY